MTTNSFATPETEIHDRGNTGCGGRATGRAASGGGRGDRPGDRSDPDRQPVGLLRDLPCREGRVDDDPAACGDGDHRAVRLRQEHVPAVAEPDARADHAAPTSRASSASTGPTCTPSNVDPVQLRRIIGMVFQRPNPFPTMSIYDNVVAGLRLTGRHSRAELDATSSGASGRRRSGTRSRTSSSSPARRSRAGSSSGCASPGRSRSTRRCS